MRKTTEVMHAHIGRAVLELRRREKWSQEDLAQAISKHGEATNVCSISRWERGADSPSPEKRTILAKIAIKHEHEDLAALFRAPRVAWHLLAHVLPNEPKEK